jgi:hypothetical protein
MPLELCAAGHHDATSSAVDQQGIAEIGFACQVVCSPATRAERAVQRSVAVVAGKGEIAGRGATGNELAVGVDGKGTYEPGGVIARDDGPAFAEGPVQRSDREVAGDEGATRTAPSAGVSANDDPPIRLERERVGHGPFPGRPAGQHDPVRSECGI